MAPIMRVKTTWSGISGAPGVTVMHFRDFDTTETPTQAQLLSVINKTATFFAAVLPYISTTTKLTHEREVEILEDTTGELLNAVTYTGTLDPQTGTANGPVAGPAGAVVNWRTGSVRNGRRVRGRTFLVPLATSSYETDGTLLTSCQAALQAAATTLADNSGSGDLGVYARPTAVGATDGAWFVATGASVPDKIAVLRSRRD